MPNGRKYYASSEFIVHAIHPLLFAKITPLNSVTHLVNRLITLTTDFGLHDAYVAIMKAVILNIVPTAKLLDITHAIAPQDIMEAAFVLKNAIPYFPADTIHLAVVDPGVGTARKPVAVRKGNQWFVGPDNGLFSLVLNAEPPDEAVVLDNPSYWLTDTPSDTFHGRDIFAPIAANLALGKPINVLGTTIKSLTPLHWALPIADKQGIQGWVVHVDRFGNCITNITRDHINKQRNEKIVKCYVGSSILSTIETTYAHIPAGEPLMLFNSDDLLEIAVNSGNASDLMNIRKGSPVNLVFLDERQHEPGISSGILNS